MQQCRKALEAKRDLGAEDICTLKLCSSLGQCLALEHGVRTSLDQLREAVALHERTCQTSQRVLGSEHPATKCFQDDLTRTREMLAFIHGRAAAVED